MQLDIFSGSVEQMKESVHDLVLSYTLQVHKQSQAVRSFGGNFLASYFFKGLLPFVVNKTQTSKHAWPLSSDTEATEGSDSEAWHPTLSL